jgi:CMP-N-acetylneuraminic acid synthetase
LSENLIALLPMKAHSSRVPGKNFRKMHGKPLFRWMLDRLLELDIVDRVLINTDAQTELDEAGLPESDRLEIKARPQHLLGDEVSMNRIIEDDIASHPASHYLMTHTTNPALSAETLLAAFHDYRDGLERGYDSLFSVTRHQTRFYDRDARPVNHDPTNLIPTQDLEPWFEENSCYYYFSPESFAVTGARIGAHPLMHETPPGEDVDIDEWRDWYLAEAILAMKERGQI